MSAPAPVGPRGRIPPRENAAPPLWFGLAFAIAGGGMVLLGLAAPAEGGLVFVAFGLFFGSIGVALAFTTVRAERARTPVHADGLGFVDVFTRSPMRILVDFVLAPLGGVGFLVFAVVFLAAGPMGFIGTAMFIFFGILVLRGSAVTIRRGVRRTVAEVGPGGVWTHDLPRRLAWDEIDRLEVEAARGAAGSGVATYRRLGIWPRDPELAARAPGRGATSMVGAFAGFLNSIAPGAGISDPSKVAPYGIYAFELEQDFSSLLRSVARYARIDGVPDDASAMLETVRGAPVPPAPLPDGVLGAALENLARASGAHATDPGAFVAGAPAGMSGSPGTGEAGLPPAGTFVRRPGAGSVAHTFTDAWMSLFFIVIPVLFVGPQLFLGRGAVLGFPPMWAFDLVAVAFIGFGIGSLLEIPGRWRMTRGDPTLVTVDERGIEMRGMGRLAWSQIAETRVVGSSIPTQEGRPAIRRLEIVPLDPARLADRPWSDRAHDGFRAITGRLAPFGRRRRAAGAFAIDLDLLADPERLLDTIARYRVVDES